MPFFTSLCLMFTLATLFVLLPGGTGLTDFFDLEEFQLGEVSFYDYRAWIAVGILMNSILTFLAEQLVLGPVTTYWARK